MKTDKGNESELLARIAALESELRRLLDLVGVEDRESIESVLDDEMAERAETELERVKAELLAVKVTEEHTFAAQQIAEADVEELQKELERVKKVAAEMRVLLEDHKNCWVQTSSCIPDGRGIHQPVHYDTSRRIRTFLESSDAGRDYVHRSELEKRDAVIKEMREALELIAGHNPTARRLNYSEAVETAQEALERAKEAGYEHGDAQES